jgi:hypothetical protein
MSKISIRKIFRKHFIFRLPYRTIFGGVSALTIDQFKSVNGFSNQFFGWGGEDDGKNLSK